MAQYECIFDSEATVQRYERLRFISTAVLCNCAKLILNQSNDCHNSGDRRILDAGSGSGRFAFPIMQFAGECERRIYLVAMDLSIQMMQKLLNKYDCTIIPKCIELVPVVADICKSLPLKPESITVALTVATFHILNLWREASVNVVETIIPSGSFVVIQENNQFMHQTEGFLHDSDFPYLDEALSEFMHYYHWLRMRLGHPYKPKELRYSDMAALLDYLEAIGLKRCNTSINEEAFKWQKPHTYADILHCFRHRQMTTWGSELKEETRQIIADSLKHWVIDHGINVEEEFLLPAELVPHIFVKVK